MDVSAGAGGCITKVAVGIGESACLEQAWATSPFVSPPLPHRTSLLYLTGAGYKVWLLQAPPANGSLVEALREIDAVLLGSSLADGFREVFLKAMTGALETATIPVLALSAGLRGSRTKDKGVPRGAGRAHAEERW